MNTSTIKTLEQLHEVLMDTKPQGPDVVYEVQHISEGQWVNKTILKSGKLGKEYPKTFGHYHNVKVNETYRLLEGEGILLLQKKHYKNGTWTPDQVDKVLLVTAKLDDEIIITPEYGHSWSNTGTTKLVSVDDWKENHTPADYEEIKNLHGMAYYLTEKNSEVVPIPNPNYKYLPKPIFLTAQEFKTHAH